MLRHFLDLLLVEVGVDHFVFIRGADESHAPDFLGVAGERVFVDEDAFSHEDKGQDEAEVDFEGFGFFGESFKEVDEDVVIDKQTLLLRWDGDGGFPEREDVGVVFVPVWLREVASFEMCVAVDESGDVFFAGFEFSSGAGTEAGGSLYLPLFHSRRCDWVYC